MTDHQITLLAAAITAGGPIFAVGLGILVNQVQLRGLDERLNTTYKSITEDIREIRRDIKDIVGKLGAMDVELGKLMDRGK